MNEMAVTEQKTVNFDNNIQIALPDERLKPHDVIRYPK